MIAPSLWRREFDTYSSFPPPPPHRYGIEGIVCYTNESDRPDCLYFDGDQEKSTIYVFCKVIVQISVDDSNPARQKLVLKLVKPTIPGFSVAASSLKRRKF